MKILGVLENNYLKASGKSKISGCQVVLIFPQYRSWKDQVGTAAGNTK